jgi:hypothetical protein
LKNLFLRVLVYTLAIGSGVMVLSLICISLVVWYSKRPEPWKKITGELELVRKDIDFAQYTANSADNTSSTLTPDQFMSQRRIKLPPGAILLDNGGFDFSFAVTNGTAKDFLLREGQARLYFVSTKSQTLYDESGARIRFSADSNGGQPILFPRGKKMRLVIHLDHEIATGDAAALYKREGETDGDAMPRVVRFLHQGAPEFGGFAILDSSSRYEIDLPFMAK